MRTLFIIILALSVAPAMGKKLLSPMKYMDKISQRLTGAWPTIEEYEQLAREMDQRRCREIHCLEDFFKTYIHKKMETPEFLSEGTLKIFDRFAFQTPEAPPFPFKNAYSSSKDVEILLAHQVLSENRSIDDLFTFQTRREKVPKDQGDDFNFSSLAQHPVKSKTAVTPKKLDLTKLNSIDEPIQELDYSGHPNIAGMFSTQRFLTRYWNTPVNGNRKRAAAIFKIMLCDSMSPALERDTQKAREQALAQGISDQKTDIRTLEEIHKNRHANQMDCAKCHSRLDPMARTLRPLELGVSQFGVPGRLRFYNAVNEPQDTPVSHFHDLIQKITQTESYNNCQMNWMFNWIVGKDVTVHPQRFSDMLDFFEKNDRRIKTTIEMLLLSPEFRGVDVKYDEPETLAPVRQIFKNCAECHQPFLNSRGDELKTKLSKVSMRLDLKNGGRNRSMPPRSHWWDPSQGDLEAIKNWISQGAPVVKGKRLLDVNEVDAILNSSSEAK